MLFRLRHLPALAAALCALACVLVSASAADAAPLGGIEISGIRAGSTFATADWEVAQARRLHAQIVRVEAPWSLLEPRARGVFDPGALALLDHLMGDATAAGIRVILVVDSSPCWTTTAPPSQRARCVPGQAGPPNAFPPRDSSAYGEVTGSLAARYRDKLAAIEIWNEPDHANEHYLGGPDKPQHYAAILKAAYPAIKAADPHIAVLAGSLVGANGVFLRDLYAQGIKGFYDGLAVHYYNVVLGSLRAIRTTQTAHGDSTPLWLDEFGWTSCYPRHRVQGGQYCVTAAQQAADLKDLFHELSHTPYVAAEVVYTLQDTSQYDFGLLTASGAHKPAYGALASVLASPFGKQRPVMLRLRRSGANVVASGSGPVGDYFELDVFQSGRMRYKALFIADRFNRFSLTLPAALGTHGLFVRVYQYWAGQGSAAASSI